MQRFFVEPHQIEEAKHHIHINGTDVNHIKNVLRMKCGEDVWISDGGEKEYHCRIEELGDDEVLLHILYAQEPKYELPNKIYLFQGLPKADKMELIIQKAVELGAFCVIPVETKRCVVKLDAKKAEKKVSRWQQIAESAAKQSKRMLIPEIHEVMTYKQALEFARQLDVKLIPYELAKGMKLNQRNSSARLSRGSQSAFLSVRKAGSRKKKSQKHSKLALMRSHLENESSEQRPQD